MKSMTLPGIVENGQIRLTENVTLPENAIVYVIVPGNETPPAVIRSPRLAHPEQSKDFIKSVAVESPDASL